MTNIPTGLFVLSVSAAFLAGIFATILITKILSGKLSSLLGQGKKRKSKKEEEQDWVEELKSLGYEFERAPLIPDKLLGAKYHILKKERITGEIFDYKKKWSLFSGSKYVLRIKLPDGSFLKMSYPLGDHPNPEIKKGRRIEIYLKRYIHTRPLQYVKLDTLHDMGPFSGVETIYGIGIYDENGKSAWNLNEWRKKQGFV